jgi:TP901 family phage tail tape measure protein
MSATTVNYQILFNSNLTGFLGSFGGFFATLNTVTDAVKNFSDMLDRALKPAIDFDAQLHELSAITGVTGAGLKAIGENARQAAKAFGVDASEAVRSYSLLLSQLSPEIAQDSDALKAMGDAVATLSKAMGGDITAAAETLTTAMNQYGVSLDNPMQASRDMADMMNVMAAAANAGSAELPQIKEALEQAGMAARSAGVSFEETNAAIQVLDKAGRRGSEGGVALRNVMTTLAKGRFLPKVVIEELTQAGVNVDALSDKGKSLSERLALLKPLLNDDALLSKLFGRETASSAMALISGSSAVESYTAAVSGTNAAYEYADTVMESYAEKQARIKARFDDMKISLFNLTGDTGIWVQILASALVPLAQLMPLLMGVGKLMAAVKAINFAGMWSNITRSFRGAGIQLAFMKRELITGQMASLGFTRNMLRATLAVLRFATVGIFNAIKGIGALILSFITGGAASVTFSGIASASFGAFATAAKVACRAISMAIFNIPIIGWIALAITAITGLFVWLYNKFDRFRATVNGIWAWFKALFTSEDSSEAFDKAYAETMREAKKKHEKEKKEESGDDFASIETELKRLQQEAAGGTNSSPTLGINTALNNTATVAAGDKKIKNINITIDRVIEQFTVKTTQLRESREKIKEMVAEAIIEGINDVNLAY